MFRLRLDTDPEEEHPIDAQWTETAWNNRSDRARRLRMTYGGSAGGHLSAFRVSASTTRHPAGGDVGLASLDVLDVIGHN